jgi:hypothetical protein
VDPIEHGERELAAGRPLEAEGDHREVEGVEPEVLAEALARSDVGARELEIPREGVTYDDVVRVARGRGGARGH